MQSTIVLVNYGLVERNDDAARASSDNIGRPFAIRRVVGGLHDLAIHFHLALGLQETHTDKA